MKSPAQWIAYQILNWHFSRHIDATVSGQHHITEAVNSQKQLIFTPNHTTHADGLFLAYTLTDIMDSIEDVPTSLMRSFGPKFEGEYMTQLAKHLKMIQVTNRGFARKMTAPMQKQVMSGENTTVFPMGRLSPEALDPHWGSLVFEYAIASAQDRDVAIIPVTLQYHGTPELEIIASQGRAKLNDYLQNRHNWSTSAYVSFSEPISVTSSPTTDEQRRDARQELRDQAYSAMASHMRILPKHIAAYAQVTGMPVKDVWMQAIDLFEHKVYATDLNELKELSLPYPVAQYESALITNLKKVA